ncbi:hypothetical protein BC830DRAFT_1101666 [Chytriomyces sp. MP71]|nr:hypothetical protein BC830DRAFT_1101666 [Chytriomyces sp. MP71]
MGVVTKLWTSNESMKEHISILSERLARVEQKTDAVIDRLDMPPPVGALIASSPNEDEDASCSSTHFLRENFKQYCSPQRAFNENKLPKNYTDIGFSLTHNDRESILTRGELDVSRVPPSSVHPSAPSIPSPMVEQSHSFEAATTSSSVPANSISIPREPFAVSLNEAPTGEYIRNIEERLKVTSELLRKAKMGHMHLQPTTSA